ncbi:MAG: hypothetical protein P9M00_03205 [Candidatus Tritonobacter lacicola]|nr:hypothetical protein [Candidatus Tritonobacter lacicola]
MKWRVFSLALIVVVLSACTAFADGEEKHGMAYGFGRAFSNIGLGWLEIPRGISYENARLPVIGIGLGLFKGCALTGLRSTYGVLDFVTLAVGHHAYMFDQGGTLMIPKNNGLREAII